MANNDEILNELFFKKKGYSEKQKDKMAQYKPVSKTGDIKSMFNGNSIDGFVVSDADEVKKRLVGALGMAMGSNTIKSSASRATKRFPIIVSDDISPETVVMIKTMMEEQYASYIDLLVSNMIINLTDYDTSGAKGNIAIQALDQLDGPDFGSSRIANAAKNGTLSLDTVMANNPGWKFLRTNENAEYTSGNAILDELLEGAIICDSSDTNKVVNALYEELSTTALEETVHSGALGWGSVDAKELTDASVRGALNSIGIDTSKFDSNGVRPGDKVWDTVSDRVFVRTGKPDVWVISGSGSDDEESPEKRLDDAIKDLVRDDKKELYREYRFKSTYDKASKRDIASFDKLITPAVFVNDNDLESSLNRSIAEILTGKNAKNPDEAALSAYMKDRFEKASFLLASKEIAGSEYISYLTDRLGIPVSQKVRVEILTKYPVSNVVFRNTKQYDGNTKNDDAMIKAMRQNIDQNQKYVCTKLIPQISGLSGKDVAIISAASAGGGLGAGLGAAGILAAVSAPIMWPAYVAAAAGVGVGGLGAAIIRAIQKKKAKSTLNAVSGWERVEALIDEMDFNRSDLLSHKLKMDARLQDDYGKSEAFRKEQEALFNNFAKNMRTSLSAVTVNENITTIAPFVENMSDAAFNNMLENIKNIDEEISRDPSYVRQTIELNEAAKYVINTKKPGDVIIRQQKVKAKEVADIIPSFGTKDVVAYGSVEYDKKEIKDRKFNEPLILTVKFKERYSDGKYADNELTAVIGILGVVTRVPSEEMVTILKANVEGKTLSNFFKGDEANSAKDLIGNVISTFAGSKYADKLPTSGKIWANLEKITALAIANKLAGNNNGNISNAHLVFSQREVDLVKSELGVDYLKNAGLAAQLMKKYSAFRILVCNDAMQYVYSYDDPDAISWDDAPYSAYMGKSNADQMLSAFTQFNRMKL